MKSAEVQTWNSFDTPDEAGLYNNLTNNYYEYHNGIGEVIMFSKNTLPMSYLAYIIEELNYVWDVENNIQVPIKDLH